MKLQNMKISDLSDSIDMTYPGYSIKSKRTIKEKRLQEWAISICRIIKDGGKLNIKKPDGTVAIITSGLKENDQLELLYYFLIDRFEIKEEDLK